MPHHTTREGQRGFIKLLIIVIVAIGALWYFKIDVRGIIGIESAYRYKYVWRAHVDRFWYGIQVWYEDQSKSSKPLLWFQDYVNDFVQSREGTPVPTSTATTTSSGI